MAIDIRDYMPPSFKHVVAYMDPAARAKRKDAARDAFGRPTPVPLTDADGTAEESDEAELDEETLKKSRWAGAAPDRVDPNALPSALSPPRRTSAPREQAKAPAVSIRKVSWRFVIAGTVLGLVVAVGAIAVPAWWYRQQLEVERARLYAAMPSATVQGVRAVPSTTSMPSETAFVVGAAPATSASASAATIPAPITTASAAPSAKASAWPTPGERYPAPPSPKPKSSPPPIVDAGSAQPSPEPVITE
jgi:hypothetical protein